MLYYILYKYIAADRVYAILYIYTAADRVYAILYCIYIRIAIRLYPCRLQPVRLPFPGGEVQGVMARQFWSSQDFAHLTQ